MAESLRTNDCIEETINAYGTMVYRLAFSQTRNQADADDIFQEVFLRYIKKKPRFENEQHKKAWLLKVTVNCAKKLWGSAWRMKIVPITEANELFATPEQQTLDVELSRLSQADRTVIHLFYYEDLSVEKISEILGQKPSTVRTRLTRARRRLKEILKEEI